MEIPFRWSVPDVASKARRLRLQLTRVTLAQVLRQVTVTESCQSGRTRSYRLRLQFLPRSAYREEFAVTPATVLQYVEEVWVRALLKRLANTFKLKDVSGVMETAPAAEDGPVEDADQPDEDAGEDPSSQTPPEDATPADAADEDNSDIEAEADDDATAARSKARHNDEAGYESPEDDDIADESRPDTPEKLAEEAAQEEDALRMKPSTGKEAHLRRAAVCALSLESCRVTKYEFDQKHERWCQLTVVVSPCLSEGGGGLWYGVVSGTALIGVVWVLSR